MTNGEMAQACRLGSAGMAVVNGLFLLEVVRLVHQLGYRSDAGSAAWVAQGTPVTQLLLTMPSLLIVVLLVALLALLVGKEWIRPPVAPLGLNLVWLAASGLLWHRLAALAA